MSLILDALRKLEREKAAHEPGVLVVGSVPWGEASRLRRFAVVGGALLALAVAGLAGFLLRRPTPPLPTPAPAAGVALQPSPTPEARPRPTATPALATPPARAEVPPAPPIRISRPLPGARESAPVERERTPQPTPPPAAADAVPPASAEAPTPTVALGAPAAEAPSETVEPSQAESKAPPALPKAGEELRLHAISERDGRPVAMINDRLVFEGDSFDGVRVLHIGTTEVEVEVGGERRVLRF